jgi:hypothetical protein
MPPTLGSDIINPPKNGGLFSIHHGGQGERTRMICGYLGCEGAKTNPVISILPALLKLNVEHGGRRSGFARLSNMPRRKSLLGVRDRKPYWPSYRNCCSLRLCGVMRRPCRATKLGGSLACAIHTLRGQWHCCTAISPGPGPSMNSAARSAYRVRRWPTALFT